MHVTATESHQNKFSSILFFKCSALFFNGARRQRQMNTFSETELDRIVEMAWEDRTTFDVIKAQFGISQGEVEKLMRKLLKPSSFRNWRKRVSSGVGVKHASKAQEGMQRFKCSRQRQISGNKISKR